MNNMFQMATILCYHILLQRVPVCCFISMFTQVALGFINLEFLFFPHCTDGTQQVRKSSSALHLLTTEEQRVRTILIWPWLWQDIVLYTETYIHTPICAPWKGTCRYNMMEWALHYWREEETENLMNRLLVTPASSECYDDDVIKNGNCV